MDVDHVGQAQRARGGDPVDRGLPRTRGGSAGGARALGGARNREDGALAGRARASAGARRLRPRRTAPSRPRPCSRSRASPSCSPASSPRCFRRWATCAGARSRRRFSSRAPGTTPRRAARGRPGGARQPQGALGGRAGRRRRRRLPVARHRIRPHACCSRSGGWASERVGALMTARSRRGRARARTRLRRRGAPGGRAARRRGRCSASSRQHLGLELSRPQLTQLCEMTGGNPFFALEIGRELTLGAARPRPAAARTRQRP